MDIPTPMKQPAKDLRARLDEMLNEHGVFLPYATPDNPPPNPKTEKLTQSLLNAVADYLEAEMPKEEIIYGGEIRDHESKGYNQALAATHKVIDGLRSK